MGGVGVSAYLSLILRRRGGRLFEAGFLLTFSAFRMGAYSRWALIRGWALIRINTVRDIWDKVEETVDITQPLLVYSWGNEVVSRNVGYGFHRVTITDFTDILYL